MRTFLGDTWVGWLNLLVVQWLFFRIYWNTEPDGEVLGWGILGPVLPVSGWFGLRYIPRKPKAWRISGE